jgi:hypothetical protein
MKSGHTWRTLQDIAISISRYISINIYIFEGKVICRRHRNKPKYQCWEVSDQGGLLPLDISFYYSHLVTFSEDDMLPFFLRSNYLGSSISKAFLEKPIRYVLVSSGEKQETNFAFRLKKYH